MSPAVMMVTELAVVSLGVGVVVGLTTTTWVEAEGPGRETGAVITESGRIVIGGSPTPSVDVVPEVDGAFAGGFGARVTLDLGFGAGVVGAAAV
jgi:hypothetical protein